MSDWVILVPSILLGLLFMYFWKQNLDYLFYRGEENAKSLELRTNYLRAKQLGKSNKETVLKTKRKTIPQNVKDKVWNRDDGKCVECGSNENLEFDHIIPFSKGGANTYRNLQLLCEHCNRSKSAKIG